MAQNPKREALGKAQDAFWQSIVQSYPEYTSGDFSVEGTIRLQIACENALDEWLRLNTPHIETP